MAKYKSEMASAPVIKVLVEPEVSMVKESVEPEAPMGETVPTVDFNVWFVMREKRIPGHHMREIIWADFTGQGLSSNETLATYDAALLKYGIKL